MKRFYPILTLMVVFLLAGCGSSLMESGDEAFEKQNFSEALKCYLEVAKNVKDDPILNEKIAMCYFLEGEMIYEKRKVIKAFEARIKSALLYLPEELSPELQKTVSGAYLKLGLAYRTARAENPYQQRNNFDKALENIQKSLYYDSTNSDASQALQQLRDENLSGILQKGIAAYNKGKNDPLQYVAADHYLTNAQQLDPQNPEVLKYLILARNKALNLLDPGLDVPIAIADQMENNEYRAYLVVVTNLLPDNLYVSAGHFFLVQETGQEIRGKTTAMFMTPLEGKTLPNGGETSGVVAFPVTDKRKFARLEFRKDGEVLGYKNLP